MAGRRCQILLGRGLGLLMGALMGMALAASCSSPAERHEALRPVREAGSFEAAAPSDSGEMDVEVDAADAAPDADPVDAGLSPVDLGVTSIVPSADAAGDASASDRTLAELSMLAAGVRARALVVRLDELVDDTGAPSDAAFANLGQTAALYRERGRSVLFTIAPVDRATDARPTALQASWSSVELRSTIEAVIDRSYDTFGPELAYLSFGTDVDRFLAQATSNDRAACATFIQQAVSYAKAHPKRLATTQIGVTFSMPGLSGTRLPETAILLRASDAAVVTNYPLDASFHALSVSAAAAQLTTVANAVAEAAPGLPIVVQELGYPSATLVGSSADLQQKFYRAAFTVLSAERDRFPFVNLYASADADDAECEREAVTFGAAGDPFLIAARCSLGLKDASGAAKPAWATVLAALSSFREP
jgi:hypothetical protein